MPAPNYSDAVDAAAKVNQPNIPVVLTDWFTYSVSFGNIAAAGVVAQNIQIQADSSFELIKLSVSGTLHGGTAPYSNASIIECNLFITDSGSGRQLMNTPVPINSIAGTGQLPYILPESRIFKGNSTVQFNVTNYSSTNQYDNVTLSLGGRKLFFQNQ
jgi:hypothetical protein